MSIFPFIQNVNQDVVDDGQAELTGFFTTLSSTSAISNGTCCESGVLNIEKYIPYWIIKEKIDRGDDTLTIFDFIQKYYDWLYCSSNECGGSGYILENKLADIIDIDKTKELYYKNLFFSYFGDFDENEKVKDINGIVIDNQTVADFVKNIKTKFNSKKGSTDSVNLFFNKLFSVDLNDIEITYPKLQIFRLNSGAFSSQTSGFSGNPQNGKLNKYRLQDGDWFQEHSYLLHTGLTLGISDYYSFYKRTLHPSGSKCILEKTINDYIIVDTIDDDIILQQNQKIGNYSSYILGQTYSGEESYKLIILNKTFYGLTYTVGCTLSNSLFGGLPLFVFPSWSRDMTDYKKFTEIPILDMDLLFYTPNSNPNIYNCV